VPEPARLYGVKNENICYIAATLLCVGWLVTPGKSQTARGRGFNLSIDGDAESCADLKVRSNNGEIAQANENFTLRKSEAPILELNSAEHGHIRVRGWDRPDYAIETCKIAVAETRAAAEQMARSIAISHSAGRVSFTGPVSDTGNWTAYFIIHAPKDASLDLETKNGPIEVRDVTGVIKVRAANGPVAIKDCAGVIEAHTTNGPIAFSGERGEVRLHAQNGPIALKLAGEAWNGSQLEARTINGPLALSLPENFRSGIRLETSGHSPVSCSAAPCRNAWTDAGRGSRTMQMNGASDTVRISTENGPVAVHTEGKAKRII
jgi:DUF4097 and DUF4098 domain-containing protein YvlB